MTTNAGAPYPPRDTPKADKTSKTEPVAEVTEAAENAND